MDVFLGEWLNLLLRWTHMIVGIGWIGTSFYFIALDYALNRQDSKDKDVFGSAWQIHGGGFYRVEKFTVAPPHLPAQLHWFQWEAYLTWVTGFGLMVIQYYWHADAYLIDPAVLPLTALQAAAISMASLLVGWLIYDGLCRCLGDRRLSLGAAVFVLIIAAAILYTNIYSGRGAFLHVGALIGTIMAVNVFAIIIPNQKVTVAQLVKGEKPDPRYGVIGKQRSLHNNYLTLPVLLMMVSPHYPFLSVHPHSWLVVALILLSGGLLRHVLNRADAGAGWNDYGWMSACAIFALVCAIYVTAPANRATGSAIVGDAEVLAISAKHCTMCHAKSPSHASFQDPPKGIALESIGDLKRHAAQIMAQSVETRSMPLGNQTIMTEAERETLGQWIRALHR